MGTNRDDELSNPVAPLDDLPVYRRILVGLAAAFSGLFAALVGSMILHATLVVRQKGNPWISATMGWGLLVVAFFLTLVWYRLWFGPRDWLDRTINRLFLRCHYDLVLITLFLIVAAIITLAAR